MAEDQVVKLEVCYQLTDKPIKLLFCGLGKKFCGGGGTRI